MKTVRIIGWIVWSLGLLYAAIGIANGERTTSAIFRDATIQKHNLWDSGSVPKEQARAALFEMNERYVAYNKRLLWTLAGFLGVGSVLLVVGRKPDSPQPTRPMGGCPQRLAKL